MQRYEPGKYLFKGTEKMMISLISKEIKDLFQNKTALIYFLLLLAIITYSFYSAVDLYSKASIAALNNPLYASGFEPVAGVFVPTMGALFIIFSLYAPFIIIRSLGDEKELNTIPFLFQLPFRPVTLFLCKFLAAVMLTVISILFFFPLIFFWKFLGGHIASGEMVLLMSGYFLYGLFVVSVSFFSASLFRSSSRASIFTLAVIMLSWFVDFGKEMNIIPVLNSLSDFTTTKQLKIFEKGVFSLRAVFYFLILTALFSALAYIFFDINIRRKVRAMLITIFISVLIFGLNLNVGYKRDISESRKNSFPEGETAFLEKLPSIDILVFFEPTDGRFKDYRNDFLQKLLMVRGDVKVHFAKGKLLEENYGKFRYTVKGKSMDTYSNSAEEIFMVLEDLTGLKVSGKRTGTGFRGYPLVVKKKWKGYLFIIYLLIFPLAAVIIFYRRRIFFERRNKK